WFRWYAASVHSILDSKKFQPARPERNESREEQLRAKRVPVRFIVAAITASVSWAAWAADAVDAEAARQEKTLSWYTSTPVARAQKWPGRSERQTGIKGQFLRSGGRAVLRRLQQEISAGRPGADVLTMSDAGAANGLAKQGILEPFRPDGFEHVVEGARD